jgi:hypothetical protein
MSSVKFNEYETPGGHPETSGWFRTGLKTRANESARKYFLFVGLL